MKYVPFKSGGGVLTQLGFLSGEAETGEIPEAECFRLLHSRNKAEYGQSPMGLSGDMAEGRFRANPGVSGGR